MVLLTVCIRNNGLLGNIQDEFLTASGEYNGGSENHGPERSRLNTVRDSNGIGGWASDQTTPAWIQADLRQVHFVCRLATQGRAPGDYRQWLALYSLFCGFDHDLLQHIFDTTTREVYNSKICLTQGRMLNIYMGFIKETGPIAKQGGRRGEGLPLLKVIVDVRNIVLSVFVS